MKKISTKKSFLLSLLSFAILGICLLFAFGSIGIISFTPMVVNSQTEYLGNGEYRKTIEYDDGTKEISLGEKDNKGRWFGEVNIIKYDKNNEVKSITKTRKFRGFKHGETTYFSYYPNESSFTLCYDMGNLVDCNKSAGTLNSAYDILMKNYPLHFFELNHFGFDSSYIKSFMDTLELILYEEYFEDSLFVDNYGDVLTELKKTPYDSVIDLNNQLRNLYLSESLKNLEIRLATIDKYLLDSNSTYSILESIYPGYLNKLINDGIESDDIEMFFHQMDSCIDSEGTLDIEDPFFTDSIDARMYRALEYLSSLKESTSLVQKSKFISKALLTSFQYSELEKFYEQISSESTPSEIVSIIYKGTYDYFYDANIFYQAFKDAFILKRNIITLPTVTTSISDTISEGIVLKGRIIKDGGSNIASKGITIAKTYNPLISDNILQSSDDLLVNTSSLEEGETYYARAYATNSEGTAYGNCIQFVHSTFVNADVDFAIGNKLILYPNPTSENVTLNISTVKDKILNLDVVSLNGQVLLSKNLGEVSSGKNLYNVNVSSLSAGIYYCLIKENGSVLAKKKLSVVSR